jgi:hypothetical protein
MVFDFGLAKDPACAELADADADAVAVACSRA